MLFHSLEFILFFPCVCLIYYVIPYRFRPLFLLACSYFFYMCWNPGYALLLLASTGITYASGLLLDFAGKIKNELRQTQIKKLCVALSFISNLSILFFFKYYNFALKMVVRVFQLAGIRAVFPAFDVLLPVGISFYIFQALGYTMDVYRKETAAEKNFFQYALFVSFFPQLVAGPIERSRNLLTQIKEPHPFDCEQIRSGLLLMLYGYFQKVVLAEYLAIAVDSVYLTCTRRTGFQLLAATILFAFQIYCDFGGYSNIAIGAARVMGFRLMENFNTPYFATSVADFWRRWHISLSTWFRDYLYIPLGGNRKGFVRRQINVMIVFLASGLWHGAAGHFVVWGFLNGVWQVAGYVTKPFRQKVKRFFGVDETVFSHKLLQMLLTFAFVDFSWIFFRTGIRQSVTIIKKILGFSGGNWFTWGRNLAAMGLTPATFRLLAVSLMLLLIVDLCKYNKINLIEWICKQGIWLRWLIYLTGIFGVLIFGVYGPGYDASSFLYFQF